MNQRSIAISNQQHTFSVAIMRPAQLISSLAAAVRAADCEPFPASMLAFSSGFKQPPPPTVKPEFTANFVQHKW